MDDNIITLGGREFHVRPFTFDQLQEMLPHFGRLNSPLQDGGFDAARQIIRVALSDLVSIELLDDLRTNFEEILLTCGQIARISGILAVGEAMTQTNAAGLSASNGTTSMHSSASPQGGVTIKSAD